MKEQEIKGESENMLKVGVGAIVEQEISFGN
jgi:hypothetical protein